MSWHIEGCEGACLACLIEETVKKHYGTQGLDFLRRKVGDGGTAIDELVAAGKELAKFAQSRMDYEDECYENVVNACCVMNEWHLDDGNA